MKREELHFFEVPPERIAQHPVEPRDGSRLMVLHRHDGRIEHRVFGDLPEYLRAGDVLVRNDTRVIPARFFGRRATGGAVEGLFLAESEGAGGSGDSVSGRTRNSQTAGAEPGRHWRVLLKPSARLRVGQQIELSDGAHGLELIERHERGEWTCRVTPSASAIELLERIGAPPLPPYIRGGAAVAEDRERYQTVYAARAGSVAAPTAGLHFTPELLARIAAEGVGLADVTLHVGLGTFLPVEADDLGQHAMHAEWYEVGARAAAVIAAAERVVAVGTTSCRTLESLEGPLQAATGWTRKFIYPPYAFRRVGALLTNFHLPGSTLIALVLAFAGRDMTHAAYQAALADGYRFFSYGDAMLIVD